MKLLVKTGWLTLLAIGWLSIGSLAQTGTSGKQPATVASSTTPFTLTIAAATPRVQAGGQVLVNITITNTSSEPRLVETRIPTGLLAFDVHDSKGNRPESRRGRVLSDPQHRGMQPGDGIPVRGGPARLLQPGKSVVVENVPVPDLYDLNQPGTYAIQVCRPDGKGKGGLVKSNTITITVTP